MWLRIGDKLLDLSQPHLMGILNVTPDSFSDGGKYNTPQNALRQVEKMLEEGASIIDIGAVSTRPGQKAWASLEEEKNRLIPIFKEIRRHFPDALLSIDTFRAPIAQMALDEGAHLINDISGGYDPQLWEVVARYQVPYVLMHCHGTPETLHTPPVYPNVTQAVYDYFCQKLTALAEKGIYEVILDPGIGFSKRPHENFILLDSLPAFQILEKPLLVGISRKSFIYKPLGISPEQADMASQALHWHALLRGARILRVHNVLAAAQICNLFQTYGMGSPAHRFSEHPPA
ncbi:MAG: dihydropteroate synthase [Bacteroidia bacterium]